MFGTELKAVWKRASRTFPGFPFQINVAASFVSNSGVQLPPPPPNKNCFSAFRDKKSVTTTTATASLFTA